MQRFTSHTHIHTHDDVLNLAHATYYCQRLGVITSGLANENTR